MPAYHLSITIPDVCHGLTEWQILIYYLYTNPKEIRIITILQSLLADKVVNRDQNFIQMVFNKNDDVIVTLSHGTAHHFNVTHGRTEQCFIHIDV